MGNITHSKKKKIIEILILWRGLRSKKIPLFSFFHLTYQYTPGFVFDYFYIFRFHNIV